MSCASVWNSKYRGMDSGAARRFSGRREVPLTSLFVVETDDGLEVIVTEETRELAINVEAAADADAEELAQLTTRLREELLDLDVEAVYPVGGGEVPDSSKGIDLLAAGALVVRFMLRQEILQSVIDGVRSWLGRQHARSIKLTLDGDSLELSRASTAEQDRLVELWVMRHGGAG